MGQNIWEPEGSCWDYDRQKMPFLPKEALTEWAAKEVQLSMQYRKGEIPAMSATEAGAVAKQKIINDIDAAFDRYASTEVKKDYATKYKKMFLDRLEDPGLVHNFLYFEIPSSEYMLQFYLSVWQGEMAKVMLFLHGYGWNLQNKYRRIPDSDVWSQMSFYEGMNNNERQKVMILLEFVSGLLSRHGKPCITSFGGGNEPLRLYTERIFNWTIFDDGSVLPESELFPLPAQRERVNYYHENLFNAASHNELLMTQHLVYMFGLSMYLGEEGLPKALAIAEKLLKPGGRIMFDFLHQMLSIQRVVLTQGWPVTGEKMYTMTSTDQAISEARKNVSVANSLISDGYQLMIETLQLNFVEPWGVTSSVFTLRKI